MRRFSFVWIRLTRKLANCLDGVDLSGRDAGDVFEVTRREAELLIAEGWAEPHADAGRQSADSNVASPIEQAPPTSPDVVEPPWTPLHTLDRLREVRRQIEARSIAHGELRRAEDRIREQFRDERARVVSPGEAAASEQSSAASEQSS